MYRVKFLFIEWTNFCCERVSSQRSPRSQSSLKVAMVTYLKTRILKGCSREVSKTPTTNPLTGGGGGLPLFKDWASRAVPLIRWKRRHSELSSAYWLVRVSGPSPKWLLVEQSLKSFMVSTGEQWILFCLDTENWADILTMWKTNDFAGREA